MAAPSADARRARASLIVLTAGSLGLQPLATDLYLPGLPAIAEHFASPASQVQLTLSVFIAGFAIAQLLAGPLSDRIGRQPVMRGGVLLFVAASLAAALAPTLEALVAARVLQSLGACAAIVTSRAVLRDLFEPEAGARVLARAIGWMTLVPLTGPTVSGWLITRFGWPAAFVAQAAFGLALWWGLRRALPETLAHPDRHALAPGPMLRTWRSILRSPVFRGHAATVSFSYLGLFAFISGSSFALIGVIGVSPQLYGMAFGATVGGYLVGAALLPRVSRRVGLEATVRIGATVSLTGGLVLCALAWSGVQSVAAVIGPMMLYLCGHGMVNPSCVAGAIGPFPRAAGAAAALVGFLMHAVAAAVGTLLGLWHDGTTRPLATTVAAMAVCLAVSAWTLVPRRKAVRAADAAS